MNELGEQAGLPTGWFNAYSSVTLVADISTGDDTLRCSSTNSCKIFPCWTYTPLFYGITPSVVYPGQKVTYIVDPKASTNYQFHSTFMHMIDVKIDDVEIDMRPFMDEESEESTLSNWRKNYIEGYVLSWWSNPDAHVTGWLHGSGYAYKVGLDNCNFENTDCYDMKVMPTITGISSGTGYTSGG